MLAIHCRPDIDMAISRENWPFYEECGTLELAEDIITRAIVTFNKRRRRGAHLYNRADFYIKDGDNEITPQVKEITTAQKIAVAKERILDEINVIRSSGYHDLNDDDKQKIRDLAVLLCLKDDSPLALKAMADYLNNEECLWYETDQSLNKHE